MRRAVEKWLEWKGLSGSVSIYHEENDRVYATLNDSRLFEYCIANLHVVDPPPVAKAFHGSAISFREDASPSMQIVFHAGDGRSPIAEMDLDMYPPLLSRPHWLLAHGFHVLASAFIGRKPYREEALIRALDRRIAKER